MSETDLSSVYAQAQLDDFAVLEHTEPRGSLQLLGVHMPTALA